MCGETDMLKTLTTLASYELPSLFDRRYRLSFYCVGTVHCVDLVIALA